MASAKTPDLVDLTKENKDRSGSVEKNKKIKQMRLPFKKINAEEYKTNLQESLEKAKTTNDDTKKRKISSDSVDEETNAGTKTPDNSKAKTGSARKKAKLDVKPKVSKTETRPKSNVDTVAKPEDEPSRAIQNVKNGGAKEEVVIDQEEPEHKPDDNVDVSDASKHEPTGVDANLTQKVKVSTPKETPRIENTPFKTPEAKSRPAKDNNLTSPMENNLTSSMEKKLTPKQLARKDLQDKARQEKEKQKEDARLAREAAKEKERKEKEAQREAEKKEKEAQNEQERLEREKKKEGRTG